MHPLAMRARAAAAAAVRLLLAAAAAAAAMTPGWLAYALDVACSCAVTALRLFGGGRVEVAPARRPVRPLHLYSFEGCPFCRRVREALSALDLDCVVHPCPRTTFRRYGVVDAASRFRPRAVELGGKAMFPLLVDDNTGRRIYESAEIVRYLYVEYGGLAEGDVEARLPLAQRLGWRALLMLPVALRPRVANGLLRRPSRAPARPLRLVAYEAEPRWRLVREALSCLELEFELTNMPFGSAKSGLLGLYDPNTKRLFRDAREARDYLYAEYAAGDWPDESVLTTYSTAGASAEHGTIPGASRKAE